MQNITNIKELEKELRINGEMVVTKSSNNSVIFLSIEEYKKKLQDEEIENKLLNAEKQINDGKTVKATEVFKELEEKYGF